MVRPMIQCATECDWILHFFSRSISVGEGSVASIVLYGSTFELYTTRSTVDSSNLWCSTVGLCPRTQTFRRCAKSSALYVTSLLVTHWVIWLLFACINSSAISGVSEPALFDIVPVVGVVARIMALCRCLVCDGFDKVSLCASSYCVL